jgi:fructose/tagatose bisphosphate aldolase
MPLILTRPEVLSVYAESAERRWVHPLFSTENLTTTEAILAATLDHGEKIGKPDLAVTVGITHRYAERPQSKNYSPSGNAVLGMRLFHADLRALMAPDSPYAKLLVLVHLDHGQHDIDRDVLDAPEGMFSSVMFDASTLSLDENIAATKEYVSRHGESIVIEGACDTISHFGEAGSTPCTPPEEAERYFRQTGVDWVVANLGTEHRAGVSELKYRDDVAREIGHRIGPRLSLHGVSSVVPDQLGRLYEDGIGKVNFWTALERDSSGKLLTALSEHASEAAGHAVASELRRRGLLGERCDVTKPVSLDFCTTAYRQRIVFESMKSIVSSYLSRWCPI